MNEPRWRRVGQTPDYRFPLANERTFLAWIRTAMAILAGTIAMDQLTPQIAPTPMRIVLSSSRPQPSPPSSYRSKGNTSLMRGLGACTAREGRLSLT